MLNPIRILDRFMGNRSPSQTTAPRPDILDQLMKKKSCPLVSVIDKQWKICSLYRSRMLLTADHSLTIPLLSTGIPTPNNYRAPSYIINVDGRQVYNALPQTLLVVRPFCEIWLEDEHDNLCNVAIGQFIGRDGEFFVFGCHGCPGYPRGAHDHSDCAYGVLRVHPLYVHPTLRGPIQRNIDNGYLSYPERTLSCELVYPPGYIDTNHPLLSYDYYFTHNFKMDTPARSDLGGIVFAHTGSDASSSEDLNVASGHTSSSSTDNNCTLLPVSRTTSMVVTAGDRAASLQY